MLKPARMCLPVLLFILGVCSEDNERAGVHFGMSVSPEMSCQLVYSSFDEEDAGRFVKMLGGVQTGGQIAFSKTGKDIHSIQAAVSWYFPTGKFLGGISSGYSFVHYLNNTSPSQALGCEFNLYRRVSFVKGMHESSHIPGLPEGMNKIPFFSGLQIGGKWGVELTKHSTCWLGYLLCLEQYTHSFSMNSFSNSSTVSEGRGETSEYVFANRFQVTVSYWF